MPQPAFYNAGYIESTLRTKSSPSPCPVSPCFETNADIGNTDHFYSEWRFPDGIRRDFDKPIFQFSRPLWTDPNVLDPNINGACIIYNPGMRQMCEAASHVEIRENKMTAKNNYNRYTGECTNTREFCNMYKVSYRDDMPVEDMANRGSGPLPSCYWSDGQKAGSFFLGSDIMVQFWEDWFDEMSPVLSTKTDADFVLATSSMREVFYLALVSVIKQHGVNYKDRFFQNGKLLPLSDLKTRTLSGQKKPKHCLDSLWDLVQFGYRRCVSYFKKELVVCTTNKQYFYSYRNILEDIYMSVCAGLGDRLTDHLHTKAVLTSLMKKEFVQRC
jgi:hypothetical protein